MYVAWAVTCRYVESDGTTGTIVGAGIDVLYVPRFPHWVSIMLAVRLAGTFEEVSEANQHPIVGRVLGPDGEPVPAPDGSEVPPVTADFSGSGWTQQVQGWLVTTLFPFRFRWWAPDEGTFTIQVRVDDAEPSLSPVHVLPHPGA